jgi:hypothetical protein
MNEKEIIEKIAFNVIQGRVMAEDEGFDEGLEGQPAVIELINRAMEMQIDAKKNRHRCPDRFHGNCRRKV